MHRSELARIRALIGGRQDPVALLEVDERGGLDDGTLGAGAFGVVLRMRCRLQDLPAGAATAAGAAGVDHRNTRVALKVLINASDQSSQRFFHRAKHETALFVPGGPLDGKDHPNVGGVVWSGMAPVSTEVLWSCCASFGLVRALAPQVRQTARDQRTARRLHDLTRGSLSLFRKLRYGEQQEYAAKQAAGEPLPVAVEAAIEEQRRTGGDIRLEALVVPSQCFCVIMPVYAQSLQVVARRTFAGGRWPKWSVVRRWAVHLVRGVSWLREQGVLHLDLKPDNVMMAGGQAEVDLGLGRLVLVDVGMHRSFDAAIHDPDGIRQRMQVLPRSAWGNTDRASRWVKAVSNELQTQLWGNGLHAAPELHAAATQHLRMGRTTDYMAFDFAKQPVFALGVLLYEVCMGGEHPIAAYPSSLDSAAGQFQRPADRLPSGRYPVAFVDLVHSMVACRPGDRPSMAEVEARTSQLPQ